MASGKTNQDRDLELIARVRKGDAKAREELVAKYLPMVKHIVKKHYASFLEFEDLMQEGFIGLLSAIDEYRPESFDVKFSSFAYMCIIRKVYNVIKQTNGNKHRALNDAISLHSFVNSDETRTVLDVVPFAGSWTDPHETVERKAVSQWIDRLLSNHLSILEYTVATLIIEGYSSGEIERAIGVSAKVVDNARTRVKQKLKRLVDTYGSLLSPGIPERGRQRRDLFMQVQIGG